VVRSVSSMSRRHTNSNALQLPSDTAGSGYRPLRRSHLTQDDAGLQRDVIARIARARGVYFLRR
jgi:hypothetical protein